MTADQPAVSVIIATRDRPSHLRRAVESVLAITDPALELIVADQSADDESYEYLQAVAIRDRRLVPLRLSRAGKARAANAALRSARAPVLAFTDDDCTVPTDWLRHHLATLAREPAASMIYGSVTAAPHDEGEAYIPIFRPRRYRRVRSRLGRAHRRGMGAHMIVRRAVFERIGGFDAGVGPGSRLRSGDDWNLAYRALGAKLTVVHDPGIAVTHWGARAYQTGEARRLVGNYLFGIGAGYARRARRGDLTAAYLLIQEILLITLAAAVNVIRGRRPLGIRGLEHLLFGAISMMIADEPEQIERLLTIFQLLHV